LKLGVCYYPEQWPETWWEDDARRMQKMGISHVRLAEFAWSKLEPSPGRFDWDWLDRAIQLLADHGQSIILCTPTATPPKWLIDAHPDILAVDARGLTRNFGSRRHYCFSSQTYRKASQRITRAIASRYGKHPAVVAWQTDNEYGCHDTVQSFSDAARAAFRQWLNLRYQTVDALNTAWGCTFWSQSYRTFEEVDPPVATVTEANPSHRLDWLRFSSDAVVTFNREQVALLRELSPGRIITHNFMGFFTAFNHHDVSCDLDVASWDSYPLGFTQMFFLTPSEKVRWARTGHPDIPAFHHDLYRGMIAEKKKQRWWVMEQQPGPVNWADWNPAPMDGMVRLWTWQAFAHGAELVSFFRWRQAPFAQEQMHTGLHRPDRSQDQGGLEAMQVGEELKMLRQQVQLDSHAVHANAAIVFDYDALWMTQIQPQGANYNGLELCFRMYGAMRQLGLNVDVVSPQADLSDYKVIVLPTMPHISPKLLAALNASNAHILLGPRAGSKTVNLQIPADLPPGVLRELSGVTVERVESLPDGMTVPIQQGQGCMTASRWREFLRCDEAVALAKFADGRAAITRKNNVWYVAAWLAEHDWLSLMKQVCQAAGVSIRECPDSVRVNQIGDMQIMCNFGEADYQWQPHGSGHFVLGNTMVPPAGVAIWCSDKV
jgi:beta-galactosidase